LIGGDVCKFNPDWEEKRPIEVGALIRGKKKSDKKKWWNKGSVGQSKGKRGGEIRTKDLYGQTLGVRTINLGGYFRVGGVGKSSCFLV